MARGPAPNASPKNRRDALELVYMAEQLGSDRRTVATRCHTKAGIGAKFLLEKVSKLPEGLTNDANSASLRRACNRAVGLDKVTAVGEKDHRCYTNHELCTAVLTVAAGFRKRRDVLYEYMLPPTTYKRYVRGYGEWLEKLDKSCKQHKLLKWGKGSLPKDLPGVVKLAMEYFGRIQPRGRPAFLDDQTESFLGEYICGAASMGIGKDRKQQRALLRDVCQAAGHPEAKGSRGALDAFLDRTLVLDSEGKPEKIKIVKASNLSGTRATAATPEKMGAQFLKMAALFVEHQEQGRCENDSGLPSADQMVNTDEGHPGHGVYNAVGAAPYCTRVWRIVDGEKVEYHASTVITTIGTDDDDLSWADDNDDNTGSGAIGTSDQFIAARERAYKRREAKRQKKEESAAETKAKKTAKLQQSIIIGARLEQRIGDDDKVIGSFKIDELKALIIARGGAPKGNKGKLQEQLRELEPMDAAALAAADTDDVVAAPAAPPAPVAAAPPPAPKSARRSSRASRSSRR